MDPTLWLCHLVLDRPSRSRWVRVHLETGEVPSELVARVRPYRDAVRRRIEEWARRAAPHRIRWITPLDREYPREALKRLHDPPGVLFVRGRCELLGRSPMVGVVGARRGTARGRRVSRRMGADLARSEVVVVSGLALGVDAAAHEGCVGAGGEGIAVLAGGLDRITPPSNAALGRRLLQRGLLISENPPGSRPRKHDFVARNRIIAGLVEALVVVEAAARSGALSTLDFAAQVDAHAMVVPGPVDCPHAQGTLAALHDGSTPVRHARDVLDTLGLIGDACAPGPLGLGDAPESAAEIARRTGLSVAAVAAALGEAEMLGQVQRVGADRWVAGASGLPPAAGRT